MDQPNNLNPATDAHLADTPPTADSELSPCPPPPHAARWHAAMKLALALAIALRLGLALVNNYANDNHIAVCAVIADEGRFPDRKDLWEGFQPKLYHTTVAAVWKTLGIHELSARIRAAQFVSCAAGIAVLFVVIAQLRRGRYSPKVSALALALVALNPKLIGISAQATNDAFVILFVSLALYWGQAFFQRMSGAAFFGVTISCILAGLSKGNGTIVIAVLYAMFLLGVVVTARGDVGRCKRLAIAAVAFVVLTSIPVATIGPYWQHYREYGSPFVINRKKPDYPRFLEMTPLKRPGVLSIADSVFTFRLIDLIRNPGIDFAPPGQDYPLHRRSLWSQLYGRAHSAHFDCCPAQWKLDTPWMRHLTQTSLLLGLLPTLLVFIGLARRCVATFRPSSWRSPRLSQNLADRLLDATLLAYLVFIVRFSLTYRSFATMKVIFIFPALLGLLVPFADICDRFYARDNRPFLRHRFADGVFVVLLASYITDIVILLCQLTPAWLNGSQP